MSRFLCQARWTKCKKLIYDEQISIIKELADHLILLLSLLTLVCGLQCEMGKRLKSTHKTPKEEEAGIPFPTTYMKSLFCLSLKRK